VRPDVFKYAVEHGLTVLTIHKDEKKLEDIFKDLTQQAKV